MEKPIRGSLGMAASLQLTEHMDALDEQSKNLLKYKEVIAVILKHTVEEYEDFTVAEIMDFILDDSITGSREVSRGRTNTQITGMSAEFNEINEKTCYFDVSCRAKNPGLSKPDVQVNLHVDMEAQKDYRPGYPIEKRGIYYLSRSLSAQLNLLTEQTEYGQLEKCYSIWICRDNIPKSEQMSISFYGFTNFKNVGSCKPQKEDYDLLQLIIIRLGDKEYESDKEDILEFLSTIFYPHGEGFRKKISKYIDLDTNIEALAEVNSMSGLGQSIYQEGLEDGIERGIEQGIEQGVKVFILDNLEEKVPETRILEKLQKRFQLKAEEAKEYFDKYADVKA